MAKKPIKRKLMYAIMAGVVASAAIILMQVWFTAFDDAVLWKLLITCILVVTVAGVLIAVVSDMQDDDTQGKDNYLG